MTRINLIPPSLCTNKQLLAEYRELPRGINKVSRGKTYKNIPAKFTMGKGHESFFGNKLWFLHKRHIAIREELKRRQAAFPHRFKGPYVIDTTDAWNQCTHTQPYECKDWTPSKEDILVSIDRLIERQFGYKNPDRWGDTEIGVERIWSAWAQNMATSLGVHDEVLALVKKHYMEWQYAK
ncbi:endonuclease V N-glycosylase UV repair enzyme [Aeromonas phage Gekk3-15]